MAIKTSKASIIDILANGKSKNVVEYIYEKSRKLVLARLYNETDAIWAGERGRSILRTSVFWPVPASSTQ